MGRGATHQHRIVAYTKANRYRHFEVVVAVAVD